jgi:hypothetical protein
MLPVVYKFSSPKLIAPVSELICENLTIPVEEAVEKTELSLTVKVPVVEILEPTVVAA